MHIRLKPKIKQLLTRLAIFVFIFYIVYPLVARAFEWFTSHAPIFTIQTMPVAYFFLLAIALFVIGAREKLAYIKLNKINPLHTIAYSILSAAFFASAVYFKYFVMIFSSVYLNIAIETILLILSGLFLGLAIFDLNYLRKILAKFNKQITLLAITVSAFYIISWLLQTKWKIFSYVVAKINYLLLSLSFSNTFYDPLGPTLSAGGFSVIIGEPCSGVTSLVLFTFLFMLFVVFDWEKINKHYLAIAFTLGIIGMFFISILRVYLLMLVGAYISPHVALGLFHNNIGWLIFVFYFAVFTWVSYPYLIVRK